MEMKQALVLSGGGAKGAYQIGVWKALRKMKIQIDIVTGTSVGALNGAMIVQKDYRNAKKLWKNMNFQLVFDEDVVEKYNDCKTTKDLLEMFSHSFFKNGGMKIQQLETIVKRYFRPHNFFASEIDYGISTYNFSKMQVEKRTKKEMNKENAPDYIVASSCCFPAFQMKKIKKDKYIDGGYADYIPLNLAIDLGAEEIIAVDLHAPGIKEKIKNKKIPITYIEPNNTIGGFLNFNKENAKTAMRFGYLDTMKVFHKFEGKRYTFKKNTLVKCQKKYNELLVNYLNQIFDFHENKTTMEELLTLATYKRMISMKKKQYRNNFSGYLRKFSQYF